MLLAEMVVVVGRYSGEIFVLVTSLGITSLDLGQ